MPETDPIQYIVNINEKMGRLAQAVEMNDQERHENKALLSELNQAVVQLNQRMAAMPDDEHRNHHKFVSTLIKESEQRQAVRAAVLQKLATGSIWSVLVGLLLLALAGIKSKFGIGH